MSENKEKIETTVEEIVEKDFDFANAAIHCSKCGELNEIDDKYFQNLKGMTGLFLPVSKDTKLSFGCKNCDTILSLVFVETDAPEIVEQEEIKEEIQNEVDSKE